MTDDMPRNLFDADTRRMLFARRVLVLDGVQQCIFVGDFTGVVECIKRLVECLHSKFGGAFHQFFKF